MKEKVILAYSGGLDTTVLIPWLKETYDYDIIAVCIDVGQGKETDGLEQKALKTGASKFYLLDVTEEFLTQYAWATLKAGAVYESKYLLGTSIARPIIGKCLVDIAKKEGAVAICHGATGKGNDQVRFELAIKALAPELKIIAPWRIWDIQSREDEIKYLEDIGIEVPIKKDDSYSRDKNLWHLSHEGLELEDPALEPNFDKLLQMSVTPEKAPDKDTYVEIEFEKGVPVAIDGKKMSAKDLLTEANKLAGENGIGIADIVENRLVGMKSRGVYETPGGTLLYQAHEYLEHLCLDRDTYQYKLNVANEFAKLVYNGLWFSPLRKALSAFVDETQKTVTGKVKLKLYKGNIIYAGATSKYSLYCESLASFTTGDLYNHKDAEGFINLFGLPLKVGAMLLGDKING